MIYRAADPAALLVEPLDGLTAVFHRASGITHLLAEPAPEMLAALACEGLTLAALMARLAADYDLVDAEPEALLARLEELVEAGLVRVEA